MDLTAWFDALPSFGIIAGLIFAGVELRNFRKSRERESALQLYKTFQTPDMVRARRVIFSLPDNLSRQEIIDLLGDRLDDAYHMIQAMEGLGTLVVKREFRLELVEDFFSGLILISWRKLKRFVEDERREMKRDTIGEWFQWMAERIMDREQKTAPIPGYIEYKDWKEK
jgi:hypothetical protein